MLLFAILFTCLFICGQSTIATTDADDNHPAELAPLMGELQRLTHKLSLSIAHSNYRLAAFYLHECLEALVGDPKTVDKESLKTAFADLIDSCNQCHQTTQHGFIKITDFSNNNPFNQDFSPDL